MKDKNFINDFEWASVKIQKLAKQLFYHKIWPDCEIISLDKYNNDNGVKLTLDIAGADKLIKYPNGTVSFLAQRFRRYKQKKYDDFTIRAVRTSGASTELEKLMQGITDNKLMAAYYAYGLVNLKENGFLRFRVVDLPKFTRLLYDKKITFSRFYWNKDKKSGFYSVPFDVLPKSVLVFEYLYTKQLNLSFD